MSHDRYFINRFAEKVCVLENGGIREYLGNYDSYLEKASRDRLPDGGDELRPTRTAQDKEKRRSREEERLARQRKEDLRAAEQAIARAEAEADGMEKALADPATWKDPEAAAATTRKYNALKEEIERLYEAYERLESEVSGPA